VSQRDPGAGHLALRVEDVDDAHNRLVEKGAQSVERPHDIPAAAARVALVADPDGHQLELIAATGYRAFPPRLPSQPIFYPVLNEEYAASIARAWNTKDVASGFVGYVTRFAVDSEYVQQFPIQTVGARIHQELWIPAERLAEFNQYIVGQIEVIAEFRGQG